MFGFDDISNVRPVCAAHSTMSLVSDEQRGKVGRGDIVKLRFTDGVHGERMWVIVTERNGDDIVGELNNKPFFLTTVNLGDTVKFKAGEILDIDRSN